MNQAIKTAGAAVVGAGVGFFVGYKLLEKRLEAAFDERLDQETAKMKEFYSLVKKPYATPEEAVEDLIPQEPEVENDPREPNMRVAYHKIVQKEYVDGAEKAEALEEFVAKETVNIFENAPKDSGKPYVISQDDFTGNATGFDQSTLTWYSEDDVVTDEREEPLAGPEDVIGTGFRTWFGQQSSDENTVHIRHEKLGLEFEVIRSEGSYKREVLGEESG